MPRKRRARSGASGKLRVVKGRVNVRVAGYLGVQKLAPSKLIPYLPATKVRQAAKRVLIAQGVARKRVKRVKKGKGKRKSTRTRRKRRTA
jgi:hypothetical protein